MSALCRKYHKFPLYFGVQYNDNSIGCIQKFGVYLFHNDVSYEAEMIDDDFDVWCDNSYEEYDAESDS